MKKLNPELKRFFAEFDRSVNNEDGSTPAEEMFSDSVMVATTSDVYAFKSEDFAKIVPKRKQFFDENGLKSLHIISLEAFELTQNYFLVNAIWNFHFQRGTEKPFDIEAGSSYILFKKSDKFKIVFHLDHEDLIQKLKGN